MSKYIEIAEHALTSRIGQLYSGPIVPVYEKAHIAEKPVGVILTMEIHRSFEDSKVLRPQLVFRFPNIEALANNFEKQLRKLYDTAEDDAKYNLMLFASDQSSHMPEISQMASGMNRDLIFFDLFCHKMEGVGKEIEKQLN